jgi:hypothetical protein
VDTTLQDAETHLPGTDDKRWQESFYLGWYDAQARIAGAHHFSLNPNGGTAHVWSWLSVDGLVVARSQAHDLPCPAAGLLDVQVGSLHVVTTTLRDIELSAGFDDAEVSLTYRAFCEPVQFSMDGAGVSLGSRHYETTGRVVGTARVGDRAIAFDAGTWQDHSWGKRELASIPSSRFFFAVFGDTLAMSSHLLVSPDGAITTYGWAYDAGAVKQVQRYLVPATIAQDGLSPISCDIRIYTAGGGGYHVPGTVDACVLMGGADWTQGDWFGMDGLTQFECGGRLGEGILEICEQKLLSPAQRASLRVG